MRLREWLRETLQSDGAGDPPPPDNLQHFRDISRELLTAGQEAINKALSTDSEAFLESTRQEGGQ